MGPRGLHGPAPSTHFERPGTALAICAWTQRCWAAGHLSRVAHPFHASQRVALHVPGLVADMGHLGIAQEVVEAIDRETGRDKGTWVTPGRLQQLLGGRPGVPVQARCRVRSGDLEWAPGGRTAAPNSEGV
jgi:hypothetical protein